MVAVSLFCCSFCERRLFVTCGVCVGCLSRVGRGGKEEGYKYVNNALKVFGFWFV